MWISSDIKLYLYVCVCICYVDTFSINLYPISDNLGIINLRVWQHTCQNQGPDELTTSDMIIPPSD